ncbi:hypothetical protein BJY01DRAFT_165753 [Aspergillus pseudoustus]|uniref:RRM domain-containing protein n=1 Tax=Aspergillus pseudoustus TaxID=1810923 RepID=A0ABR4K822_9EURO
MADAALENPAPQLQTPQKQYQNGVRTTGRAFNSPNWRVKGEEASPSTSRDQDIQTQGTPRGSFGGNRSNGHVPQAISEGRRLYVGNMPYSAKMEDVQALFNKGGFETSRIDISIDPFSGRNPSYCFVDLKTKELADRAMTELDGSDLLGRQVKIKPGVVKSASERAQQRTGASTGTGMGSDNLSSGSPRGNRTSPFNADRWRRDDASASASASAPSTPSKFGTGANTSNSDASKRLYVGGLPRLADQEAITSNITGFFKDYTVYVVHSFHPSPINRHHQRTVSTNKTPLVGNSTNITKLFTPHPAKRFEPGDHYYLFVDFATVEEAQNAMAALNGVEGPWGSGIRVQRARGEMYNPASGSREREGGEGEERERRGRWTSSVFNRGEKSGAGAEALGVEA